MYKLLKKTGQGWDHGLSLENLHVLVTGGSKGVGAALVSEIISRGGRATVAARPSASLDDIAKWPGVNTFPVDLSDLVGLIDYVERAEAAFGNIDVLINNAALVRAGPIDQLSAEDLRNQMFTNLIAPMELCRQVLPRMIGRKNGVIVNVSSMVAEISIPNLPAYIASKAGLSKFTLDLQGDLTRRELGVCAILAVLGEIPGTQINAGFREDSAVAKLADKFARLPVLSPQSVARSLVEKIERRKNATIVLPRYNGAIFHFRNLPVKLTQSLIE